MKLKLKINKKRYYRDIPVILLGLFMFTCVFLDGVEMEQSYVKAGEIATFTMNVRVDAAEDHDAKMVISFLAPKSWNVAANAKVTYTNSELEGVMTMSLVPADVLPVNGKGLTWEAALRNKYGFGPNVLSDMEWVTYWSDYTWGVKNHDKITAKVKIEAKAGPDNLKFKPGFFLNHTDDGLGGEDHYKVLFSEQCFEVVEGEGPVIDFCELHFNMVQPLNATKDDIMTFKFQGDIESNALDNAKEIYMWAKAYTSSGNSYEVSEKSSKTKMSRETRFGKTYSLTFWPAGYFDIPEEESITRIDYFFVNEDGSLWMKEVLEDENETEIPYNYEFVCK